MDFKQNLLYLLERPLVSLTLPRGRNNTVFKLPESYLPDQYKGVCLDKRYEDANVVDIRERKNLPDISECLKLGRRENFSLFQPKHLECASRLIAILMECDNLDCLQNIACYCREKINPHLFNYAYTVVLLHRKDTSDLDVPTLINFFPDKFVQPQVLAECREDLATSTTRREIEVPVDFTASNLEPEHRLAYWREDVGINLHHWHWHLVFPEKAESREMVAKDRRGELFYYMHHQMLARYNLERLCNHLARVRKFSNWKEPIPEAYFPKLTSTLALRGYPPRAENQVLQDVNRPADELFFDVQDLVRWRDRIYAAIHSGSVKNEEGKPIELTEKGGIDILGNIIESSILSPNRSFYGNLHNRLHVGLGLIHDPDHRHLEQLSVIGDNATAVRDPIFFRLHAFIDDIFQEYKDTLTGYKVNELEYKDLKLISAKITCSSENENEMRTFWEKSKIDFSKGLDFQSSEPINVRFTHLQHRDFNYRIEVSYSGPRNRQGTCRIFMAPKYNENGNEWNFTEQRNMFVEMDRFIVSLRQGVQVITRKSSESSVTIPFERTFRKLDSDKGTNRDASSLCGCGWPQHMLVAKGTPEGYRCELFVMISDEQQETEGYVTYCNVRNRDKNDCQSTAGSSFCGLKDKKYPDRRAMGFPFDRLPREGVKTLKDFLTSNMIVQDITIKHSATTLERPE